MGIVDVIKRANNVISTNRLPRGKKMSSDEVELNYFKERERQMNIRRELAKYRASENILKPRNMEKELGTKAPDILKAKNCFGTKQQKRDRKHSILNQRRIF